MQALIRVLEIKKHQNQNITKNELLELCVEFNVNIKAYDYLSKCYCS